MYGSIFSLDIKPGHHEEFLQELTQEQTNPTGMVALFVMNPDEKDEWIGVAVFENKEAYVANSQSTEQHERFLKMMAHLDSEPKWTDGTYVLGEIN